MKQQRVALLDAQMKQDETVWLNCDQSVQFSTPLLLLPCLISTPERTLSCATHTATAESVTEVPSHAAD